MPLLSFCFLLAGTLSQSPAITATVDVTKTSAPISKSIYGQFLDHGPEVFAVLNPSDTEQNVHLDIHGSALTSNGKLWRMAAESIDATVKAGSPGEVQVEEQSLVALPATVTLRPYSVNIYSNLVL